MATNPQAAQQLPILYRNIVPLSSQLHSDLGFVARTAYPEARGVHAVPITVDEFAMAQRYFPIIFTGGPDPAPLALFALNDGYNLFVDEEGNWQPGIYIPAYFRRYPFVLAQLQPNASELSLCVDDTCPLIVKDDGQRFFDGAEPTQATRDILSFCEQFEQSVSRTRGFMQELVKLELLMDGEVTVQVPNLDQPFVYRGFGMVSEEKIQALRGDQARKMIQNGMIGLVYAHFFSLGHISELFDKQQRAFAAAAA